MSLHDEISAAIAAHGMWKTRLRSAIALGKSDFSPSDAGQDNRCAFGKWIHGITDPKVVNTPEYRNCRSLHRDFHGLAGRVLALATSGKKADAEREMAAGGEYATVSGKLTRAMMEWSQKTL